MKQYIFAFLVILCALLVTPSFASSAGADYYHLSKISSAKLFAEGKSKLHKGQVSKAMPFFLAIVSFHSKSQDKQTLNLCILSNAYLGDVYYSQGLYNKAFDAYAAAIRMGERKQLASHLPTLYNALGRVYCTWNDYSHGLYYYNKALLTDKGRDKQLRTKILYNLFGVCYEQGSVKKAQHYYDQLIKTDTGAEPAGYLKLLNKALLSKMRGNVAGAIADMRIALNHALEHNMNAEYVSAAYLYAGDFYASINKDSMVYFYRQGLQANPPANQKNELLRKLASAYQNINKGKAQIYTFEYLQQTDSLFNVAETNRRKSEQFVYEIEKEMEQIRSLKATQAAQLQKIRYQRVMLATILLVLVIIASFTFVISQQKKKLKQAYRNLFLQSKDMMTTEQVEKIVQKHLEEQIASQYEQIHSLGGTMPTKEKDHIQSVDKLSEKQKNDILVSINKIVKESEDVFDCDFTIIQLAKLTGYNSKYLSKVIKDNYGTNFRAFINNIRIKEAQRRLVDDKHYGQFTISAIAHSVGYKSHPNFIQLFKKYVGVSPSEYRMMSMEVADDK